MPQSSSLFHRFSRSLQWRLALPAVSLLSVVLLTYGAITALQQSSTVASMLNAHGHNLARSVAAASVGPLLVRDLEALEHLLASQLRYGSVEAVQIVDGAGKLVVDVEMKDGRMITHFGRAAPALPPGEGGERAEHVDVPKLFGISLQADERNPVLWQAIGDDRNSLGWVRVTVDRSPVAQLQAGIWRNNLLLLAGVIAISIGGLFILLHRPLGELQRAADFVHILADASGAQAPGYESIAEIDRLFTSLNQVSSSLASHQRAILAARDAAEAANRAKSHFLANMSHELRTPMNGILNLSMMLQRSELAGREQKYVRMINTSGKQLMALINDLIDFSELDEMKVQPQRQPFDLDAVLAEVQESISEAAAAKGLLVSRRVPPELPRLVVGDALRLRQALTKYAENGVKFTERGEVRLVVEVESREAEAIALRFVVEDTGIGIAEADQGRLFRSFEQVDGSRTRKYGGTGLGLAIVGKLAELLGGTVGVSSVPGEGSRFWLRLSVGVGTPVATDEAAAPVTTPAVAPELAGAGASDPGPESALATACRELAELIAHCDTAAARCLETHADTLRNASPGAYDRIDAALRGFDFETAKAALSDFEPSPTPGLARRSRP